MKFFKKKKKENESEFEQKLSERLNNEKDPDISLDNIEMELSESEKKVRPVKLEKRDMASGNRDTIADTCNQIAEAKKQVQEAKLEYKAVTDYLADIQKIDGIAGKEREELEDAARNIITLTRERSKYQTADVKLSDVQFRNISRYEDNMLREIKQMRENEDYQRKVKGDLRQLAAEKAKLEFEKDEIIRSQEILKKLAVLAGSLIVLLDVIFLVLTGKDEMNLNVPFILSIILGAGIAFYIFYESRRNRIEILNNSKKRNKLVGLTNRVKIKYVNTQNALDYAYEKFMVSNSMELSSVYDKYVKAKREAEQYRSNTGMLNFYNNTLIGELKMHGLKDCDIWIYQAAAIIDNREMVEIRHRLNERRQKLRERIDFSYEVQKSGLSQLKLCMEEKPELQTRVLEEMTKAEIEFE
ncbi:MAG TPA: hypothetical protein DCW90_16320 [Lachnospiraceae bacterium]|nr:hypothetical protein [uncultured Lachnoclostridium sp.]HAU86991.1 hypothetical protein [Lachnospiraceae bacterium]